MTVKPIKPPTNGSGPEVNGKPIATAATLRDRPILVEVPGTTPPQFLACQRPDPLRLIADGILPMDLFVRMFDAGTGQQPLVGREAIVQNAEYIRRWTCAAVVRPTVVLTEAEAAADPESVWVEDVEPAVRLAVLGATSDRLLSARVTDAVAEFRREPPLALRLYQAARAYGTRPSQLLSVTDPILALNLDLALSERAAQEDHAALLDRLRSADGFDAFCQAVVYLLARR